MDVVRPHTEVFERNTVLSLDTGGAAESNAEGRSFRERLDDLGQRLHHDSAGSSGPPVVGLGSFRTLPRRSAWARSEGLAVRHFVFQEPHQVVPGSRITRDGNPCYIRVQKKRIPDSNAVMAPGEGEPPVAVARLRIPKRIV
jgi:hypothetical protein